MHGKRGAELLEELQKSAWLPPYNDSGVRSVSAEIRELLEALLETLSTAGSALRTDQSAQCGAVVYHRAIERNKRCVLAYINERARRIIAYRWDGGPSAATHLVDTLSGPESTFLNEYEKILGKYSDAVELDLTADKNPPRDLYIEIRVVRSCGEISTDAGTVHLKQGTQHFLKRADVEHLIRQGALEHIV